MHSGKSILGVLRENVLSHAFLSLGILYNASPGSVKKAQVEEWIKANYPGAWEELENMGRMRPSGRDEIFLVDRYVDIPKSPYWLFDHYRIVIEEHVGWLLTSASLTREAALASEAALKTKLQDEEENEAEKWE